MPELIKNTLLGVVMLYALVWAGMAIAQKAGVFDFDDQFGAIDAQEILDETRRRTR